MQSTSFFKTKIPFSFKIKSSAISSSVCSVWGNIIIMLSLEFKWLV